MDRPRRRRWAGLPRSLSALLRLEIDLERGENAVVHDVDATQHSELDHLALAVVLANRIENVVRHTRAFPDGIDIGKRRPLGLAEELGGLPILQRFALLQRNTIWDRDR